jgi:hypothetical protein
MGIRAHLGTALLLATLLLSAQTTSAPAPSALGQGQSVDHVGVGVNDLTQAQHDYEQFGFNVIKGGHFPGGLSNSIVTFQNNSYLELLSVSGSTPVTKSDDSEIADFVKKHEGAMFLGINVSSAKAAADYLKAHNFDVTGPEPGSIMVDGQTTAPPPMWYSVSPTDQPAYGKRGISIPIFFIEYVSTEGREKRRAEGKMDHPNTAMGIHSAWFAVHDVEAQSRTLRDAGLELGESREAKFLGAHGREVKAGKGTLLFLESGDKNGPLEKYLSDHDEGIIGISIAVADLGKARQLAETGGGRKLETYRGFYGTSFLLTPELTHGVWIEMFQPAEH